jgi:hypothetical protein
MDTNITKQLLDIFYEYEDIISNRGNVHTFFGDRLRGVSLHPSQYREQKQIRIKCNILIELTIKKPSDRKTIEPLADYIGDFCRDNGIADRLLEAKIDPTTLDWWSVEFKTI